MQTARPNKLPNPPRRGGKPNENSGFRSAERCLRSLLGKFPSIAMKFLAEDGTFLVRLTGS
jgi:hypothetical protein